MKPDPLSQFRPWLFAAALFNAVLAVPLGMPELLGVAGVLALLCMAAGPLFSFGVCNHVNVPAMPTAVHVEHVHRHYEEDDDESEAWKRG